MMYLVMVAVLVASIVFALAGVSILVLFLWTEAKEYAHALTIMQRIVPSDGREFVTISRTRSRNHDSHSVRAS